MLLKNIKYIIKFMHTIKCNNLLKTKVITFNRNNFTFAKK